MTLLNWWLSETQVVLLADTLALHGESKEPARFVAKVLPLQHLNAIVTGTGVQRLVSMWAYLVAIESNLKDIEGMAARAPEVLRGIWAQLPTVEGQTATVYHFGWSAREERFLAHVFRSTASFEAELLPPQAIAHKPGMPGSDAPAQVQTIEDLIALVALQRAADDAKPKADQVGIGGDLLCYEMWLNDSGAPAITCSKIYRFDDYEADLAKMEGG